MHEKHHSLRTRLTALLLALICALGLFPTTAFAASDTITLKEFGHSGVAYQSAALGRCTLHEMTFKNGNQNTTGFCGTKGGGMGTSLQGQTWGTKRSISDPTVETMMAYYYAHSTGVFTDEAKALGVADVWGPGYRWYMNAWVQACIWRYQQGSMSDPVVACAEELMAVYNTLEGTHYTSIDEKQGENSFRDRTQFILEQGAQGVWGKCAVYEYTFTGAGSSSHPASSVQKIILGDLTVEHITQEEYALVIKKVDATNPSKGLAGAGFHVESQNGTFSQDVITGQDGTYRIGGLSASTYSVTETTPPPGGYQIDSAAPQYVTLPGNGNNTVTVTFRDSTIVTSEGSIRKVDADNPTKGLAGAVIKITGVDNNFVGTYTTGEGGYITDIPWDSLPIGSFVAEEVTPPEGYSKSTDQSKVKQTFVWDGKTDVSLVFENDAKVKLQLKKLDDSNNPLPGAVFNIVRDGQIIGTEATKEDGSITVTDVTEGLFAFVEVSAPSPFAKLDEPVLVHVDQADINGGGTITVTAADKKLPNLTILKRDKQTGDVIPDTHFEIRGIHYGYHDDVTTGPNGKAILDDVPQTATIQAGQTVNLEFRNQPKGSVTLYKYSSLDRRTPLEGVGFKITFADRKVVDNIGGKLSSNGIYYTDSEGQINISGVTGTLVFTEVSSIPGYLIDENRKSQTIEVNPDDHQSIYFYNQPVGNLLIKKMSSTTKEPLSDVVIRVTRTDGTVVGESNGEFRTDENGFIKIPVEPGSYIVQEVRSKPGFLLDDTPHTIEVKGPGTYNIELFNQPLGSLIIHKYSSLDRKTPLAGVQFKVTYAPGCVVDDENGKISSNGIYYTGPDGTITINGIVGTVTITEQATIPGYTIDPETRSQTIVLRPDDVQHAYFYNSPKNTLIIEKYLEEEGSEHKPLKGVTFLVTDSSGAVVGNSNGEFISGDDGRVVIPGVEPGSTINVREIKVPEGVVLDGIPKSIKISDDGANILRFYNKKTGYLVVRKLDKISKAPLSGVEFELTYAEGGYVDDANGHLSSKGRFKTNDAGEIRVPVVGTVVVKEVKTLPTHVIDEATRIQTITVNPADTQTLVVYNEPLCSLTLTKKDAISGKPVPNTEFTLKDGDGNILGRYTTGQDGTVTVTGLIPNSTVVVVESRVPSNYVLDPTPRTIIVRNGSNTLTGSGGSSGTIGGGTSSGGSSSVGGNGGNNVTVENIPKTTLTIEKLLETETGNVPLKGVTFLVTDSSGAVVGPDNGEYTTDENGRIVISKLEPGVTITAKEVKVPDGVVLDSTPKSIKIKGGEGGQTLRFINKATGYLVIKKLDKLTSEPLAGVEFKLSYASGEFVDDANGHLSSLGLYKTDANGEIRVPVVGTVVVEETRTLPNYTIDPGTKRQVVTVNPADTQTLTVYNAPGVNLKIQKYIEGAKNEPLEGVTFLVTDSSGTPLGPNKGEYVTDRNGQILLTDLTPGTTITAKEVKVPSEEYVLDGTPQSILIKEGTEGQQLVFYNKRVSGLELIKVSESDRTKRIPNVKFEIRKMDGALVETVTTDSTGRVHVDLDAGDYYAVEIEAGKGFKVDETPQYFTIRDNECTTLTVTNKALSGILIHKVDSVTKKGIYGVSFLLYDSSNTPVGQYTSDNQGYVYIEGITTAGRYYLRELENEGYITDTQMKTVYVKPGETTLIEWENTPISGQIQITKKSADYNSTNGLPAGTLLEGAVFEIYDKASNLVDTIRSDGRGLAVSRQLPLGRYTIREVKAPANYGVNETPLTAYLEHEGQIVRFEVTNKSMSTGVSITKTGPAEAMAGQPVNYTFSNIANGENIILTTFGDDRKVLPCRYIDATHARIGGETWHICEFAEAQEQRGAVYAPEHPREGDICDTYTIYQIKDIGAVPYAFMPYEQAKAKLRMSHYQRAYRGVLAPKITLENLYAKHNQDSRPFGQRMRSLSMSDVIVLNRGGQEKAYYVDRYGFQEAKRFLNPPVRKRKPPRQER